MKLRTAAMWGIMEVSENKNLFTNITGVKNVATTIALTTKKDTIVVKKSTVLDGTNGRLRQTIDRNKFYRINNKMDLNLEFIREESIICDSYYIYQIITRISSDSSVVDKFRSLYITTPKIIPKIYNYITGRQILSPSKVVRGKF